MTQQAAQNMLISGFYVTARPMYRQGKEMMAYIGNPRPIPELRRPVAPNGIQRMLTASALNC